MLVRQVSVSVVVIIINNYCNNNIECYYSIKAPHQGSNARVARLGERHDIPRPQHPVGGDGDDVRVQRLVEGRQHLNSTARDEASGTSHEKYGEIRVEERREIRGEEHVRSQQASTSKSENKSESKSESERSSTG